VLHEVREAAPRQRLVRLAGAEHEDGAGPPARRGAVDRQPVQLHPLEGGQPSYQCTPFIRCASAIASPDAFSSLPSPPLSPRAAVESGNTL
jgi:hypothetical protein